MSQIKYRKYTLKKGFTEFDCGEAHLCSGILDKNGKQIFEGDIVQTVAEEPYIEDTKISDVIMSDDLQFCVRTEQGYEHGLPLTWGAWVSLEVIGNIYENPELLTS